MKVTNSRPFYSDYVKRALRFYSRSLRKNVEIEFKTEADKNNWNACNDVILNYSDRDRELLLDVYAGMDTLPDEVYQASEKYKVSQNFIWDLMKGLEKAIAIKRGLL